MVIGRQPSPRALLYGFDEEHEESEMAALAALFPTVRQIDSLSEVREEEYDILITKGRPVRAKSHLFVVAVAGDDVGKIEPPAAQGSPIEAEDWRMATVRRKGDSKAAEFEVPPELPKRLKALVYADLLPLFQRRNEEEEYEPMSYLSVDGPNLLSPGYRRALEGVRPVLTTTEPVVLAGIFRRRGDLAECLTLPGGVDVVAWTAAAVEMWSDVAPDRFPVPPAWEHAERWMTTAERQRARDLENLDSEWDEVQAGFAGRRAAAEKALAQARTDADTRQRRLLVAQGDDLVAAVSDALQTIGFEVRNMDALWPENDRREDLRVTAADHPGWNAIVEVRGYTRGAAQSDLIRIGGRFVPRYMQDEGRAPSSAWYIVNHNFRRDPSQRPRVLSGNEPEIETFAEGTASGLVVDTVTLFQVVRAVEEGLLDPASARATFVGGRGTFRWTPPGGSSSQVQP